MLFRSWVDRRSLLIHSQVDRLFFSAAFKQTELRLGRQRINWGIANVWNPNDLFNAFNFLDYNYEERPGSDAVRVMHNLSNTAVMEAAVSPSKTKKNTVAAALYKWNRWKYDFQVLLGYFKNSLASGGGWAGSIGDAGFKGEITWFHDLEDSVREKDSFSGTLMTDYSFKNSWYGSAGVLYESVVSQ